MLRLLARRGFSSAVRKPSAFPRALSSRSFSTEAPAGEEKPTLATNPFYQRLQSLQGSTAPVGLAELFSGISRQDYVNYLASIPEDQLNVAYDKLMQIVATSETWRKFDPVGFILEPEMVDLNPKNIEKIVKEANEIEIPEGTVESEEFEDGESSADAEDPAAWQSYFIETRFRGKTDSTHLTHNPYPAELQNQIWEARLKDPKEWTTHKLAQHFNVSKYVVAAVLWGKQNARRVAEGKEIVYNLREWFKRLQREEKPPAMKPVYKFMDHEEFYEDHVKEEKLKQVLAAKYHYVDPITLDHEKPVDPEHTDEKFTVIQQASETAPKPTTKFVFVDKKGAGTGIQNRNVIVREEDGSLRTASKKELGGLKNKFR